MKNIDITYQDGSTNKAAVFRGANAVLTVICLPALGVRASYYEDFCKGLNAQGMNVVLIDWRGNGHSSIRASRANNWGYEQLVADLDELVTMTEDWFLKTKLLVVGHSLGGQMASLYASRYVGKLSGIVLVASCLVHYKGWAGFGKWKVWSVGHFFAWVSRAFGFFPGKRVGFGGREAKDLMLDWGKNARNGKYELRNSSFDYEKALPQMQVPILAVSMKGDALAPKAATANLYAKFHPKTDVKHLVVTPEDVGVAKLTHFNWVKNGDYFVSLITDWAKQF